MDENQKKKFDEMVKEYIAKARIIKHRSDDGPWQGWGWTEDRQKETPPEAPKEEVNEWGMVSP